MQLLDLDSSAPRQSFDWIVELALRLNLVIEVLDVYEHRGDIEDEVYEQLEFVVGAVKNGVIDTSVTPTTFPEPTPSPSTTVDTPSETTVPSTSTTQAEQVEATGWVFLDVDADGEFSGAPSGHRRPGPWPRRRMPYHRNLTGALRRVFAGRIPARCS